MKQMIRFITTHRYSSTLLLILFIAAALRFYNIPGRYTFDYDATSDAVVAYRSVEELQLPLTGNFSSAGAFTFGPWYYYHLAAFYFLTRIPYSVWLLNGILSLVTVVVMYGIGRELKGRALGLILALLTAVSPAQIGIAASSSNPNLVVFYAALTIYLFIRLVKDPQHAWYPFLLGISVGIAINAHYQAIPLLFFPFMLLLFSKTERVGAFLRSAVGVAVTFLPLLFFNLTNHWHTVRNFFYYSLYGKDLVYVPNSWTLYIRDFWPQTIMEFFGIPYILAILLVMIIGGLVTYLVIRKKIETTMLIFIGFLVLTFVYMRYYWGERHFVYFYYLHPLFYLFTGYAIYAFSTLKTGVVIAGVMLITLVSFGLSKDMTLFRTQNYPIYEQQADQIMRIYPGQQISVYLCKGRDLSRGSALSYFLDRQGASMRNAPVKLALFDSGCLPPKNAAVRERLATREAELLNRLYPKRMEIHAFDFSTATEAALLREGWEQIDTHAIYESEVRWWFNEQP